MDWKLVSAHGNLVQNSDFALHWVRPDAPDHWHYEPAKKSWISDNIPVVPGNHYLASMASSGTALVHLEWMAQHWQTTGDAAISLNDTTAPVDVLAPATAVYVRFVVVGADNPSIHIRSFSFVRSPGSTDGTNSRSQTEPTGVVQLPSVPSPSARVRRENAGNG